MPAALILILISAAAALSIPYSLLRFELRLRFPALPATNPTHRLFRRWRVFYWLIWAANAVFVAAVILGAATLLYFRARP
jgi:choline-glycine betaine transporter